MTREAKNPAQANVQPDAAAATSERPARRQNRYANTAASNAAISTPGAYALSGVNSRRRSRRVGIQGKLWMLAANGDPRSSCGYQAGKLRRGPNSPSTANAIRALCNCK